jgi:hypothetical protein
MDFWQRFFRRLCLRPALTIAAILLAAEITCRFGFGLGNPPLEIRDPACGYRFSPSQIVARFGNRVSYDANSARGGCADPPSGPVWKTLVIGDSVLDGGSLTDDRDTATEVLNGLSLALNGRTLRFINLSAGSWAPPQQLGYLNAYGTLGADAVVLVLSSHDALGPAKGDKLPFPTQKPWTATEEVVLRYLLGLRRHLFTSTSEGWEAAAAKVPSDIEASQDPTATSIWCLKQIVALCRQKNLPVAVVLWPTRSEVLNNRWAEPADVLLKALDAEQVPRIDLMSQIRVTPDFEATVYRDDIHPTVNGQNLVAGAVLQLTLRLDKKERGYR